MELGDTVQICGPLHGKLVTREEYQREWEESQRLCREMFDRYGIQYRVGPNGETLTHF